MTVNVNGKHNKLNVNGKHNKLKVANRAQPNSSILRTATHVAKVSNRNVPHSRFSSIFVSRLHASVTNLGCVRGQYHTNNEQTQSVEGII